MIQQSKVARGIALLPGDDDTAVVAARGLGEPSVPGDSAHLLGFSDSEPWLGSVIDGTNAFGDDNAGVSGTVVTPDGKYALIADHGLASPIHRLAIVEISTNTVTALEPLTGFTDPTAVIASPFNDAVLVSGAVQADAIYLVQYDPSDSVEPFTHAGEITYSDSGPALPGVMVGIEHGTLEGLVLVAEVTEIRRLMFNGDGTVSDLGVTSAGAGVSAIVSGLGVQP